MVALIHLGCLDWTLTFVIFRIIVLCSFPYLATSPLPPVVSLRNLFPGVLFDSRATGACPVTTDLIMQVLTTTKQQQQYYPSCRVGGSVKVQHKELHDLLAA